MNIVTNELINAPKMNIPLALAPNMYPEIPNTENIPKMIALTTAEITSVIMIKPM